MVPVDPEREITVHIPITISYVVITYYSIHILINVTSDSLSFHLDSILSGTRQQQVDSSFAIFGLVKNDFEIYKI